MIAAIKTDQPEAHVAVYVDGRERSEKTWQAGRELSNQLLIVIEELCQEASVTLGDVAGVIIYEGPGSYTGLRIGMSVANAIGSSHNAPVVGVTGASWIADGLEKLKSMKQFSPASPKYGGEVHTSKPRK